MSTKLWYSTIGHLATHWLALFSGNARACAYAHMIFTAVSKRDAVSQDAMFLLTKVMYSMMVLVAVKSGNTVKCQAYGTLQDNKYGYVARC